MKKHLFLCLLVIMGLTASSGWLSAQTTNIQSVPKSEAGQTTNIKAVPSYEVNQTMNKVNEVLPSEVQTTNIAPMIKIEKPQPVSTSEKCGVNTFSVSNDCGMGAFKNVYFQCHDGYEENQGGETSCKTSETWQEYARNACAGRCRSGAVSSSAKPVTKAEPTVAPAPVLMTPPVVICSIGDSLMKDYNNLIVELKTAEASGEKQKMDEITQKIVALKKEITRSEQECRGNTSVVSQTTAPTITINRCAETARWEGKLGYYKKIGELGDSDLKQKYGFSREEVKKISEELEEGLKKIKLQCENQNTLIEKPEEKPTAIQVVTEQVKPVAVQSAQEINDYYKARIKTITGAETDNNSQIENLKALKQEVNSLTSQFVKSRKEIEASELTDLAKEIKVSAGEIKADEVTVNTIGKKILLNVGEKSVSVEPSAKGVLLKEKTMETRANEVFIKDGILNVGNSEVKLLASDVAGGLGITPVSVELKEENAKAVYKMKINEQKKLFGLFSVKTSKVLTADADNGNLIGEKLPWYSFLMTK